MIQSSSGRIDGVHEDVNPQLVLRYFFDRYRDGRFFAEDQTSIFDGDHETVQSGYGQSSLYEGPDGA